MQKVACVFSYQMSSWVSCQKIVFNLHKSYQLLDDLELYNFNYNTDQTAYEHNQTAKEIYELKPHSIVILDHKPHPYSLFRFLSMLYTNTESKPRVIFHIFGDFTLHYESWSKLAELLKGWPVEFVVASNRQKILMDRFLSPPHASHICPFPVDPQEFNHFPELRIQQRAAWGIAEHEHAFVFTGRITRQKRILSLLQTFVAALKFSERKDAHLYIYGNIDHIADPFIGIWETEGEYFRKVFNYYRSLPEEIQQRIHFMGSVPNAELKAVYQGADTLVNLSVHNDEDYGMSVAEAQASGLPAILTDWGGLAGFEHTELPEATFFVPVKIGKRAKLISLDHVIEGMVQHLKPGHFSKRQELSEVALSKLSVEAGSQRLRQLLSSAAPRLDGFSPFFDEVSINSRINPNAYIDQNKNINQFFRKIYSAYVRNH